MKAMVAKLTPTVAGILLVVPFMAVAILVGHRALTVASSSSHNSLFVMLAVFGVAMSVVHERPSGTLLSWPVSRRNRL